MSWEQFFGKGFELTEAEVQKVSWDMIKQYRALDRDIQKEMAFWYSKYLTNKDPKNYYNIMIQYTRVQRMGAEIQRIYNGYGRTLDALQGSGQKLALTNKYYRGLYNLQYLSAQGVEIAFGIVPEFLVEWSVYGTENVWNSISAVARKKIADTYGTLSAYQPRGGTLTDLLVRNRQAELQQIRQTITSGLMRGESFNKTAKAVHKIIGLEQKAQGRIGFTGAKGDAIRIVRTEGTRNLNAGNWALDNFAISQGVEMFRDWLATLDTRTRQSHARLDGVRKKVDEEFFIGSDGSLFPGGFDLAKNNVYCRCTTISTPKGISPELRRGRNPVTGKNEVFSYTSFDAWASKNNLQYNKSGRLVKRS